MESSAEKDQNNAKTTQVNTSNAEITKTVQNDQIDQLYFLNDETRIDHNLDTFIIAIINCDPSWRSDDICKDDLKDTIQNFISKLNIFSSRKSKANVKKGGYNFCEIKQHDLLYLDCRLVLSVKPPINHRGFFNLLDYQNKLNKDEVLLEFNLQSIWIPAGNSNNSDACTALLQYTFDRFEFIDKIIGVVDMFNHNFKKYV